MAYFPHAYKKVFIARSVDVAGGTGSDALTAGEVALLDKSFQSFGSRNWTRGFDDGWMRICKKAFSMSAMYTSE